MSSPIKQAYKEASKRLKEASEEYNKVTNKNDSTASEVESATLRRGLAIRAWSVAAFEYLKERQKEDNVGVPQEEEEEGGSGGNGDEEETGNGGDGDEEETGNDNNGESSTVQEQLTAAKARIETLEGNVETQKEKVTGLRGRLQDLVVELYENVLEEEPPEALRQETAVIDDTVVNELRQALQEKIAASAATPAQVAGAANADSNLTSLQNELGSAKSALETAEKEAEGAQAKVTTLENDLQKRDAELGKSLQKVAELEGQLDNLRNQPNEANEALRTAFESELNEVRRAYRDLAAQVAQKYGSVGDSTEIRNLVVTTDVDDGNLTTVRQNLATIGNKVRSILDADVSSAAAVGAGAAGVAAAAGTGAQEAASTLQTAQALQQSVDKVLEECDPLRQFRNRAEGKNVTKTYLQDEFLSRSNCYFQASGKVSEDEYNQLVADTFSKLMKTYKEFVSGLGDNPTPGQLKEFSKARIGTVRDVVQLVIAKTLTGAQTSDQSVSLNESDANKFAELAGIQLDDNTQIEQTPLRLFARNNHRGGLLASQNLVVPAVQTGALKAIYDFLVQWSNADYAVLPVGDKRSYLLDDKGELKPDALAKVLNALFEPVSKANPFEQVRDVRIQNVPIDDVIQQDTELDVLRGIVKAVLDNYSSTGARLKAVFTVFGNSVSDSERNEAPLLLSYIDKNKFRGLDGTITSALKPSVRLVQPHVDPGNKNTEGKQRTSAREHLVSLYSAVAADDINAVRSFAATPTTSALLTSAVKEHALSLARKHDARAVIQSGLFGLGATPELTREFFEAPKLKLGQTSLKNLSLDETSKSAIRTFGRNLPKDLNTFENRTFVVPLSYDVDYKQAFPDKPDVTSTLVLKGSLAFNKRSIKLAPVDDSSKYYAATQKDKKGNKLVFYKNNAVVAEADVVQNIPFGDRRRSANVVVVELRAVSEEEMSGGFVEEDEPSPEERIRDVIRRREAGDEQYESLPFVAQGVQDLRQATSDEEAYDVVNKMFTAFAKRQEQGLPLASSEAEWSSTMDKLRDAVEEAGFGDFDTASMQHIDSFSNMFYN